MFHGLFRPFIENWPILFDVSAANTVPLSRELLAQINSMLEPISNSVLLAKRCLVRANRIRLVQLGSLPVLGLNTIQ